MLFNCFLKTCFIEKKETKSVKTSCKYPELTHIELKQTAENINVALKKMLELKLPVVKVVYDCETEDSHRANKKTVIIPHTGIVWAT